MAFETILKNGKNPKSFNLGNKTGAIAATIIREAGEDKEKRIVTMKMYDLIEVQPSEQEVARAEKGGYDALPRLYLVCEYENKKGVRVKCNDQDFIDTVLQSKKNEIEVTVEASEFTPDGQTRPRSFFTLESWS